MQGERNYRAFISYRHSIPDKPIAEALQKHLERYKVPGYLRKQGYPKSLGYIFRDEMDLPTSSDLGHQIEHALDNSDYLIVVCSPQTPHSKYVAAEIDYFKRRKGDDKCLTLLAAGDPTSEKVFPDELLKRYRPQDGDPDIIEPIAADVRAKTLGESLKKLKKAKLKLIAGLLGCNYDDLVRRQRERRLKQIAVLSMAAVAFLVCFGLFLLRQLYILNESQRQTQLAYSQQSLLSGDHVLAMEQAILALEKNNTLFSKEIAKDTKDSLFKASLIPAFSKYTKIPLGGKMVTEFFSADGQMILLHSNLSARAYDLNGRFLWEFTIEGKGDRIIALSPDGTRAALAASDDENKLSSRILLWDIPNDVIIRELVESRHHQIRDVFNNEFSNVLGAFFSADGKTICAYRTGGYFNQNESIQFWNASTGELEKSFEGSLLGTRQDGGQGSIISECRFYQNGIVRFQGSTNFVFVHPEWDEPVVVPMREKADNEYIILSEDACFGIFKDSSGVYVLKDRSSKKTVILPSDRRFALDRISFLNQRFAILPVLSEQGDNLFCGVQVIDLENMAVKEAVLFSDSYYKNFKGLNIMTFEGSDRVYALGTHGSRAVGKATFTDDCSTLFMLTPKTNTLSLLSDDLYYLNEGEWKTTYLAGTLKDFLISRQADYGGMMKVLEISPENGEIISLYHIPKGEEFDAGQARINKSDCFLMVRNNLSIELYAIENQPATEWTDKSDLFVFNQESELMVTFSKDSILKSNILRVLKANKISVERPLENSLSDLYLSADDRVLAGVTEGMEIVIFDTERLNQRCRIPLENGKYDRIDISPDGKRILVLQGSILTLYDSASGLPVRVLSEQTDTEEPLKAWAGKVAFSPDGSVIAGIVRYYPHGGEQYTRIVVLWDTQTGEEVGIVPTSYDDRSGGNLFSADNKDALPPSCEGIFFSDSGRRICTTYSGTVWIWDLKLRKLLMSITNEGRPTAFLPPKLDDTHEMLFYATQGMLNLWDVKTGAKVKSFTLDGGLHYYAISPEGRWLLGCGSEGVWLFDLETGEISTKLLNQTVIFTVWFNEGKSVVYYPIENNMLKSMPYLYQQPYEICRQWQENNE